MLERKTVAVAGNPNSGKTTLFNAITGATQRVGNYPGVTVEKKEGDRVVNGMPLHIVDLPGTYSLTAYSQEEVVARDYIIHDQPDLILSVVDASNLERNLYLTLQLCEMGLPVVVALNMHDVAVQRGIHIDIPELERLLGAPVVPTVGHRKEGVEDLLEAVRAVLLGERESNPLPVDYGPHLEDAAKELAARIEADEKLGTSCPSRFLALKLLEMDEKAFVRVETDAAHSTTILGLARGLHPRLESKLDDDPSTLIAEHRYGHAAGLMRRVRREEGSSKTITDAIDTVVCNRVAGLFFVLLCIYAAFTLTFSLADAWQWIPTTQGWVSPVEIMGWVFEDWMPTLVETWEEGPLKSMILDGVIGGVGGVMGFAPIIFFMFVILAMLEDSGYIARIAFVLDRILRAFGLQGKSILAMIVSGGIAGGCAVPGVMATRTLREEKDRLTTMLVAPFMSCGAKIPVFALLVAAFYSAYEGEMMLLMTFLGWVVALLAAWVLRRTVIKGEQAPFVMELPPYHLPTVHGVMRSATQRTWMYVKKAGTIILAVNILLWALMYFPRNGDSAFKAEATAASAILKTSVASTPYAKHFRDETLEATLAHLGSAEAKPEMPEALLPLWEAMHPKKGTEPKTDESIRVTMEAMDTHAAALSEIGARSANAQLTQSFAGRIGGFFEPVTKAAGFEWRTNIALIGGFAAKEVIVGALGTAYSMTNEQVEQDMGEGHPLARKIQKESTPLKAFALMIFVLIYAPCFVTVAVIGRESGSWKWALFSTAYSTVLAFGLAVIIYQGGLALGLG